MRLRYVATATLLCTATVAGAQQRETPISSWITDADIPDDVPETVEATSVHVALTVSPTGTVSDCRVVYTTGYRPLSKLTCALLEQRARYIPAFSVAGEPIESKDELSVWWNVPQKRVVVGRLDYGGAIPANNPSYWVTDLDSAKLSLKSEVDVEMIFSIGRDGSVSSCQVPTPSGNAAADALSCALLTARAKFRAPIGRDGLPMQAMGHTTFHWAPPPRF